MSTRLAREYSEPLGHLRKSFVINMEEDNDKQKLIDGRQPYTASPPYSPPNEYDNALFHDKGKSPKEVGFHDTVLF